MVDEVPVRGPDNAELRLKEAEPVLWPKNEEGLAGDREGRRIAPKMLEEVARKQNVDRALTSCTDQGFTDTFTIQVPGRAKRTMSELRSRAIRSPQRMLERNSQ